MFTAPFVYSGNDICSLRLKGISSGRNRLRLYNISFYLPGIFKTSDREVKLNCLLTITTLSKAANQKNPYLLLLRSFSFAAISLMLIFQQAADKLFFGAKKKVLCLSSGIRIVAEVA